MNTQFSLAHLTVLECSPPEMTYIAARAGYDFVSFRPISLGTPGEPSYPLGTDRDLLKDTKTALADTGLKLLDIELARIYDGVDPKSYVPAMEAAAELGGKHVLTSGWTNDQNCLVDCYAELCDLAQSFGLTVDFEFVAWASVSTLTDAVNVVRQAGRQNGGILIDTLHARASGLRGEQLDDVPQEWFHYAQICDAPAVLGTVEEMKVIGREARLYPGEGEIDIAAIVRHLPAIPYSLEIPNKKRARELGFEEFARQCLVATRAYFNAASIRSGRR